MRVIEIIKESLKEKGFSGLIHGDGECGCEIDDLAPCGIDISECRAGYKHCDPRPEHPNGFSIWDQKEPPTAEQWEQVEY